MPIRAFTDYLSLEKNYSGHTVLAYRRDVEAFSDYLEENFGTADTSGVNYAMIRSWIVSLVDKGVSNRSVNRKVSSLKAFYKFLLRTGQIAETPLAGHKALKTPKTVQIPFSEDEVTRVLQDMDHGDGFDTLRDRVMVELFYTTGMRKSELIRLKVSDVDIETRQLKVLGKRDKERYIPLLSVTLGTLTEYIAARSELKPGTDYLLLNNKGKQVSQSFVYRKIKSYFSAVSSKLKISPHILRHTFATHLLNNGAGLNQVKELLGHASLASTQVYTHNSIAELKKAYTGAHPRSK